MHVQIDESGRNDQSASIELLVRALDLVRRRDLGHASTFDQDVHGRVDLRRRIDQVAALDQQTA